MMRSLVKTTLYSLRRMFVPWRNKHRALVLAYHSIGAENDYFTVPESEFQWQMQELKEGGFNTVSLSELEHLLSNGSIPPRTVAVTFDDGRADNFSVAYPVLRNLNIPATIFLATSYIDSVFASGGRDVQMLTPAQIQEMRLSGIIEFGSHTVSHRVLTSLSEEQMLSEISESSATAAKLTEKECISIAYPRGKYDESVIRAARNSGMRLGFTTENGFVTPFSERLALPRNGIDATITKQQFLGILAHGRIR